MESWLLMQKAEIDAIYVENWELGVMIEMNRITDHSREAEILKNELRSYEEYDKYVRGLEARIKELEKENKELRRTIEPEPDLEAMGYCPKCGIRPCDCENVFGEEKTGYLAENHEDIEQALEDSNEM